MSNPIAVGPPASAAINSFPPAYKPSLRFSGRAAKKNAALFDSYSEGEISREEYYHKERRLYQRGLGYRIVLTLMLGLGGLYAMGTSVPRGVNQSPHERAVAEVQQAATALKTELARTIGYYESRDYYYLFDEAEQNERIQKNLPSLTRYFQGYFDQLHQKVAQYGGGAVLKDLREQLALLPSDKQDIVRAGLVAFDKQGANHAEIYGETARALLKGTVPDDQVEAYVQASRTAIESLQAQADEDGLPWPLLFIGLGALVAAYFSGRATSDFHI